MHLPALASKSLKMRREIPEQANGMKSHLAIGHDGENCFGEDVKSFLSDEQHLHRLDDLTKVNPVTTTTVLKCLQARYAVDIFYTNAGSSLVAVNPFQPIPSLYSLELMREYHTAPRLQELKPHVFVVAEEAYRNLQSQIPPVNQSIIVSGESGAGKTWTSRCLMKFYATVATSSTVPKGSVTVERIEKRVLDSNPVMEAFGNACTLRNSNSSRFGKYIQLQLNRSQHLTSASIQTFLLEKTRVAYQAPHERNFHIFYQIAKGASQEEQLEWDLPKGANFLWLPNPEKTLEEDSFEVTREAMSHLGIDCSTQHNVFKILAGLLHLGNIQFSEPEDESQPCELEGCSRGFAMTASRLLKVPVEELSETLRIRTIRAGKQQQVFKKVCPKTECGTRRDCLAKVVYARVFDWLVAVINGSIYADPSVWSNFIGLLDVYGFESFPDNHLEQLCINYANEKLQQHFVGHFLKAQQEEYATEGLEWSFINYEDNLCCLDVIEGSPVSIFSLLNEECRLNRPSNAGQLQSRIEIALSDHRCIGRDRFSKKPNFTVSHYAGDVRYQVEGMVEKNKDPVPPELVLLLQLSQDSLLQKLFPVESTSQKTNDVKPQTKPVVVTVVSKFKGSLEKLMGILHSTTPHYVRCIKPNADCAAALFRKDEVLDQLEACGIVEAVNISAAGFPIRISFGSFAERYKVLRRSQRLDPNTTPRENSFSHVMGNGWTAASMEGESDALRSTVWGILQLVRPPGAPPLKAAKSNPSATPVYCGKTKVFMTNSMLELLEAQRAGVLSEKAFCIQCCWRRFKRRKVAKQRESATIIQSAVRSWLARKHFQRIRKAATVIKRTWRRWKAKMNVLAAEELDDLDRNAHPSVSGALVSSSESDKSCTLNAAIQFWPLGLVLPSTRATVGGFQRELALLACLQVLRQNDCYKAKAKLSAQGITSIRALPQGSIKFHCRKSPLLYADTRPHTHACTMTGFNQILLDNYELLSV
ncbi:unconventional myosin-XIX isoform X1 [Rhineura floridana]|uniref:unconventional myosin-XIX isoform X1 n=1 Tax=Rhineura floridana TaxID=261503 RepID=UPI002AC876F5|nr:unconventional myosin-XIX isoform X1 [Rhineura floridana]XP_061460787.1 unconventional myosin-XIX isoform X1 [Rhineura floridana]XP_061460788.1 unconventional myosin-XIX isoform X1 [Rhineura floridana]XP_061460790.1 unconventional myosin-XIX isoform X1 [Rhineura floridana]XP_061460791.1 unconventional myosin-XIX isoform X1 [Rhineura floridana]XP_061460792.1 unconventional myosin-XIX isoform X1 [Rhineura floridana]